MEHSPTLEIEHRLFQEIPSTPEQITPESLAWVLQTAEAILDQLGDRQAIEAVETEMAHHKERFPAVAHLAIKLARSRRILLELNQSLHLTVILAVYKETIRIQNHNSHPDGEDFLLEKIRQMQWLCRDLPGLSWDMLVVDDGCPDESGKLAQTILNHKGLHANVQVRFLADAIRAKLPITQPMSSTDESRKGGSILYGLWEATRHARPDQNHLVIYTDADLSTHLGQIGLLVEGILHGADLAIGSRREPLSMVIKQGQRNDRGKLFIYLWKRMLTNLGDIVDTQCGFKAFRAEVAHTLIHNLQEKQFAFDIELLLKAQLNRAGSTTKIPIVWIDSEICSTTTNLQPYLPMLKSIAGFYRTYLPPNRVSDAFAAFVMQLDERHWYQLVNNIPEAISTREPREFGHYGAVSVAMLAKAAGVTLVER